MQAKVEFINAIRKRNTKMESNMFKNAPKCDHPSECRFQQQSSAMTLAYYPPVYDRNGNNLNPDRNTTTTEMKCTTCGKTWVETY